MARSFLGGEFAGGESAWWRGNWIPRPLTAAQLRESFRHVNVMWFILRFPKNFEKLRRNSLAEKGE